MIRALLELFITVVAVFVARAILTSVMRGFANAGRMSTTPPAPRSADQPRTFQQAQPTGELHKDPVCGTYVAESTPFRRQSSGQTFYYCSANCKEKHSLVAK